MPASQDAHDGSRRWRSSRSPPTCGASRPCWRRSASRSPAAEQDALNRAIGDPDERRAVGLIDDALAGHVLLDVTINPESRVSVVQGRAAPALVEGGSRLFLVRVRNQAGVTAPLRLTSPNGGRVSSGTWQDDHEPAMTLTARDAADRWAELTLFDKPPMSKQLSGLGLEYRRARDLQPRSRASDPRRSAWTSDRARGDIGFAQRRVDSLHGRARLRRRVPVPRREGPSLDRILHGSRRRRTGVPARRRSALRPILPFQPHVYRGDGETSPLPAGRYEVSYSAGPEYVPARGARREARRRAGVAVALRALDRSRAVRLLLRRPPRARGRLRALPEPDAGCRAGRHDPAGAGGSAQHRRGADVGPVLLPPEAVLQRRGSPAVDAGSPAALRRRGVRIPVEPRRASRPARPHGAGLSRRRAYRAVAIVGPADPPVGRASEGGRRLRPLRLGPARRRATSCPTTRCRPSTASAPTSTSWT